MAAHIIRVFREMTDMAPRHEPASESYFYNDIDGVCTGSWEPNTDIFETNADVIIRLELANVFREEISIVVKNGKLHITGKRRGIQLTDQVYFHQMEIHCGEFGKIIALPEAIQHNEITASLQEGILEIRISKQSNPIEIPIAIEPDRESNR